MQHGSYLKGGQREISSGFRVRCCRVVGPAASSASSAAAGGDGGSARLGSARSSSVQSSPARPGPTRPGRLQLHPPLLQAPELRSSSGGRVGFKAEEQQLSSGSGPPAAAVPPFRWKSESVQRWLSVGGRCSLSSSFFTAEGPRLQEGKRERRKRAGHAGKCGSGPRSELLGVRF